MFNIIALIKNYKERERDSCWTLNKNQIVWLIFHPRVEELWKLITMFHPWTCTLSSITLICRSWVDLLWLITNLSSQDDNRHARWWASMAHDHQLSPLVGYLVHNYVTHEMTFLDWESGWLTHSIALSFPCPQSRPSLFMIRGSKEKEHQNGDGPVNPRGPGDLRGLPSPRRFWKNFNFAMPEAMQPQLKYIAFHPLR